MPDSSPVRADALLPQRRKTLQFPAQLLGNAGEKNAAGRPAIPARLIKTNTVTSVLYDEQIHFASASFFLFFFFFNFAAAAAHPSPGSELFSEGKQVHC